MHAQHADDLRQAGRGDAEAARVAQRADTAAQKRAHHVCGGRWGVGRVGSVWRDQRSTALSDRESESRSFPLDNF